MTRCPLTIAEPTPSETADPSAEDRLLALPEAAQALLFREAHTANTFTDEPVTEEQLRAVHDLIKYAPTSANTQPLRATLIRSSQARQRVLAHMSPGNRDKTAEAPLVAVLTADREFHRHLPTLVPHVPNARERFADAEVGS